MLQLGVRGHDVPHDSIESLVKNIKDEGFCCTQLALSKAIKECNTAPSAMTSGMAMYLRNIFENTMSTFPFSDAI